MCFSGKSRKLQCGEYRFRKATQNESPGGTKIGGFFQKSMRSWPGDRVTRWKFPSVRFFKVNFLLLADFLEYW